MFEKRLVAGWGDMDFNSHMRNTAFLDKSADVRMMFFSENAFSMDEFIRRKIGPVVRKDEGKYFKEVRLLEEVRITLAVAGLAEDGSHFLMRNEFWRADETLAATVTSAGGGSTSPSEDWWCRQNATGRCAFTAAHRGFPKTVFEYKVGGWLTRGCTRLRL